MKGRTRTLIVAFMMLLAAAAHGEERTEMKIKLSTATMVMTATLLDNATSRDFFSMLPMTLTLRDYSGTEKISDLRRKLSTEDAPEGHDPSAGDITLYAPWGNLAIFYKDFGYARGLVHLGRIDTGLDELSRLDGVVRIERTE